MHARRYRWAMLAVPILLLAPVAANADDNSWGFRFAGTYNAPNDDGLFFLAPQRRYGLQETFVTVKQGGLFLNATAYNEAQDGATPYQKAVVNEFFYDTKLGEWDFTLGKKRIEWGVGFGFRPLDVIKPVARRELIPGTHEGLPLIVAERYTEKSALTFLVGNDFRTNDSTYTSGGTQSAVRYYTLADGVDVQVLAHTGTDVGYEGGFALAWTANEELELHGSALYQRHYRKWVNSLIERGLVLPPDESDPMRRREFDNGAKALVGGTYTWHSGNALMLEYWYDDSGYSGREWNRLRKLTVAQRALPEFMPALASAVNANVLASSQYLLQPNLMQQNWLLRWSYDNGEHFVPALDVLFTPQDRGRVVTLSATHDIGTAYNLNYGLRYYGGDDDSAYRALPYRYIVYAVFKTTLNW